MQNWNINRSLSLNTHIFTLLYEPQKDDNVNLKDKSLKFCIISSPIGYVSLYMTDYCKVIKVYKYAGLAMNHKQLAVFIDK